jgi:hypothetical protein
MANPRIFNGAVVNVLILLDLCMTVHVDVLLSLMIQSYMFIHFKQHIPVSPRCCIVFTGIKWKSGSSHNRLNLKMQATTVHRSTGEEGHGE